MSGALLTPGEAAALLGETERWVRNSLRDGTLPGMKVRGRWRISRPQLDAWLADEPASVRPRLPRQVRRRHAA